MPFLKPVGENKKLVMMYFWFSCNEDHWHASYFHYFVIYTHPSLSQCLQGIIGYICGSEGLDSSGLSSSAAVSSDFSPPIFLSLVIKIMKSMNQIKGPCNEN